MSRFVDDGGEGWSVRVVIVRSPFLAFEQSLAAAGQVETQHCRRHRAVTPPASNARSSGDQGAMDATARLGNTQQQPKMMAHTHTAYRSFSLLYSRSHPATPFLKFRRYRQVVPEDFISRYPHAGLKPRLPVTADSWFIVYGSGSGGIGLQPPGLPIISDSIGVRKHRSHLVRFWGHPPTLLEFDEKGKPASGRRRLASFAAT